MSTQYVYTVWLRQLSLPEDDPDFEWPACFLIEGTSAEAAKHWGDYLSQRYARKNDAQVVSSAVEAKETCDLPGLAQLPLVREGEDATDKEIGW
jgi:hypothetical protein